MSMVAAAAAPANSAGDIHIHSSTRVLEDGHALSAQPGARARRLIELDTILAPYKMVAAISKMLALLILNVIRRVAAFFGVDYSVETNAKGEPSAASLSVAEDSPGGEARLNVAEEAALAQAQQIADRVASEAPKDELLMSDGADAYLASRFKDLGAELQEIRARQVALMAGVDPVVTAVAQELKVDPKSVLAMAFADDRFRERHFQGDGFEAIESLARIQRDLQEVEIIFCDHAIAGRQAAKVREGSQSLASVVDLALAQFASDHMKSKVAEALEAVGQLSKDEQRGSKSTLLCVNSAENESSASNQAEAAKLSTPTVESLGKSPSKVTSSFSKWAGRQAGIVEDVVADDAGSFDDDDAPVRDRSRG